MLDIIKNCESSRQVKQMRATQVLLTISKRSVNITEIAAVSVTSWIYSKNCYSQPNLIDCKRDSRQQIRRNVSTTRIANSETSSILISYWLHPIPIASKHQAGLICWAVGCYRWEWLVCKLAAFSGQGWLLRRIKGRPSWPKWLSRVTLPR